MKTLAIIIAFITGFSFCSVYESTYTRKAIVNYNYDGIVNCTDDCGYEWEFYGDDFFTGQAITLIMDTNHTDNNIFDDIIKKVLTK